LDAGCQAAGDPVRINEEVNQDANESDDNRAQDCGQEIINVEVYGAEVLGYPRRQEQQRGIDYEDEES